MEPAPTVLKVITAPKTQRLRSLVLQAHTLLLNSHCVQTVRLVSIVLNKAHSNKHAYREHIVRTTRGSVHYAPQATFVPLNHQLPRYAPGDSTVLRASMSVHSVNLVIIALLAQQNRQSAKQAHTANFSQVSVRSAPPATTVSPGVQCLRNAPKERIVKMASLPVKRVLSAINALTELLSPHSAQQVLIAQQGRQPVLTAQPVHFV